MKKIVAMLLAVAFVGGCTAVLLSKDNYVLLINEIPVNKQEFQMIMNEKTAETFNYFKQNYGIDDSARFWDTAYDGVTPLQYVKELAVKELVMKKNKLALMQEEGIINDVSFEGFLKDLENENRRRKEAVNHNEVIYGPVEYGVREYDIYLMSNREIDLKNTLSQGALQCSEQEIKDYYINNIDKLYKLQDTIIVKADGEILKFKPQLQRHDSTEYPEIHDAAVEMKVGEKRLVPLPEGESVNVECISKTSNGYMSFDEAYDSARQAVIDTKYEKLISNRIESTKIDINYRVYNKLKVR